MGAGFFQGLACCDELVGWQIVKGHDVAGLEFVVLHRLDVGREHFVIMASSTSIGATMLSSVRAAKSVLVFQWL